MAPLRLNIVRFGIMITITMIDDKITLMTVMIRIVVGAAVMLKITAVILLGSIFFFFFLQVSKHILKNLLIWRSDHL